MTPFSVMMPAISSAGVTSKAGLYTATPSGAVGRPKPSVTSRGSRCSIGIAEPSGIARSNVLDGAAVGADLVGRVAVGGDPVGADDDRVEPPLPHDLRRHVVADQRHRHAP